MVDDYSTETEISLFHQLDDALKTAAKLRREIFASIELLQRAHAANARNKPHIVDDHIARVIDALTDVSDYPA